MKIQKKTVIIVGSIILVLLIAGALFLLLNNKPKANSNGNSDGTSDLTPPIDDQLQEQGVIDYGTALQRLKDYGGLIGNQFDEYAPTDIITRAEFIKVLYDLMHYNQPEDNMQTTTFSDVPTDYWANKYIAYIENAGIIDSVQNSEFKPDEPLLFEDAVKWVVRLYGGKSKAEDAGGMFEAYYSDAQESGWLANIPYYEGDKVNYYTVIMLIYNTNYPS